MFSRAPHLPSRSSAAPSRRPSVARLAALFALGLLLGAPAERAVANDLPTPAEARLVNDETVGIVFHYEDVYRRLIDDMIEAFGEDAGVRIVPMIGLNHAQTVYDVLHMNGVDLGIVHADVLEYMAREMDYDRGYRYLRALVEIWIEKVAIIAGEGYDSLEDLAGEKVNFREPGKGSDITATILFDTLGIEVEPTRFDKLEALEKVKSGEIAAMVYLIEEPVEEFTSLSEEDGVRLIEIAADEPLLEHYRAADLTDEDFPGLVAGDDAVATIAVPVVIAAYNWPESEGWRYGKSRRFVDALIGSLDTLKEGDSAERWRNVSLERDVPGMERLPMVDQVLAERERLAEERAAREAAEKTAALRAQQEELIARLNARIANSSDTGELAELESLIEELEKVLDEGR